jgi:hypothetical protein
MPYQENKRPWIGFSGLKNRLTVSDGHAVFAFNRVKGV